MRAPGTRTPISGRKKDVLLLTLLGVTLVLAAAKATSSEMACAVCHAPQVQSLAATPHKFVHCYDCHVGGGPWGIPSEKSAEFFNMYPAQVLRTGLRLPAKQTSRASCLSCHKDVLRGPVERNGIHIDHAACAGGASCDPCHSSELHPEAVRWITAVEMTSCLACHEENGASQECHTCHEAAPRKLRPTAGAQRVIHGPDWKKTHGMGGSSGCTPCHTEDHCSTCHGTTFPHAADFGGTHGELSVRQPDRCKQCHPDPVAFCDGCHGIEMPHASSFKKQHPQIAEGTKDPKCMTCHTGLDCAACHKRHVHPGGAKGVPVPWTLTDEGRRP